MAPETEFVILFPTIEKLPILTLPTPLASNMMSCPKLVVISLFCKIRFPILREPTVIVVVIILLTYKFFHL